MTLARFVSRRLLAPALALATVAGPALAQNAFDQVRPAPGGGQVQTYQGPQGFSFQGDQLPPSHDRPYVGRYDERYSQTYQQQQAQAQANGQRVGGGCLRYGAVGAAGGHLAGHTVSGALAGCAVGMMVRRRDRAAAAAAAEQNQQAPR